MPKSPKKEADTESQHVPTLRQSELAELLARVRHLGAFAPRHRSAELADAVRAFQSISSEWSKLAASSDWKNLAGLHAEALKASDFASVIEAQTEALKALNWDAEKLPQELRLALKVPAAEPPVGKLEQELRQLREKIAAQSETLLAEKADAADKEARIAELTKNLEELRGTKRLAFLLNQIHPAAQTILETDAAFRDRFLTAKECTGFVLSVDIRRSTELMLKARRPEQFASFLSELSQDLTAAILESFGVFDKFTGDGVLAFFPDFYTGPDFGFHVLSAASRCHEIFRRHYRRSRDVFVSVLQDTGLGIGIDFGTLHLVQVGGALTVVGPAVVYACRLAGAPPDSTLLNQPAYEVISERYASHYSFEETTQELKHHETILAYRASPTGKSYQPSAPEWFKPAADDENGHGS